MSLYNPNDSRDNCGFGLIAHTHGEASHELVSTAIHGLDPVSYTHLTLPTTPYV